MNHQPILAAMLGAALVAATASTADATPVTDSTTQVTTGVSGYAGQFHNLTTGYTQAAKRIRWRENLNNPCWLTFDSATFDNGRELRPGSTWRGCSSSSGSERSVGFPNNPRYYVRGISVCTTDRNNSANNRLKGIRIYPARVTRAGAYTALNTYEQTQRANCAKWHPPVYCPSGYVAHGLRVHYSGNTARGIALNCREVVVP